MTSSAGERNAYTCATCNSQIITVHADDGVTPMFLACRATAGCRGRMVSGMYRPVDGPATWEWYRPTRRATKRLDLPMRQHVEAGGLMLRQIDWPVEPQTETLVSAVDNPHGHVEWQVGGSDAN